MPNAWPGFILQAIATEFGVEIYSEYELNYADENEGEPKRSYVPLDSPTDEEIAAMRAEWKAEYAALDEEMEILRAKRREERAAAG
jgi:hypothetical protein